eukprot:5958550-Prymnesium_polylepis.1
MSLEQTTCTPAMQAACECVCDLYGLDGVEEDLSGVMLMAEAFPNEPADTDVGMTDTALLDEIAKAESLEGLQNKVYRLRNFLQLLRKDMETSAQLAGPKRDQLKNKSQGLSDRYGFMNVLKVMQGESVLQAALTAMLLILHPEVLQKEQDPFAAATAYVGADSSATFQKFIAVARGLEQAINDGRTQAKQEDWATAKVSPRPRHEREPPLQQRPCDTVVACSASLQGFVQFVEQNYKNTSWRSNSTLCINICEYVIGASGYYEITSEMVAKKAQSVNLDKELQAAKKELDAAAEKDDRPGGISATSIKQ